MIIIIIIVIFFFLYQNVRITEVLTAVTERLRTLITTVIVTVQSDLDGSVSKGPQAQECHTDRCNTYATGWLNVDTLQ